MVNRFTYLFCLYLLFLCILYKSISPIICLEKAQCDCNPPVLALFHIDSIPTPYSL